jgi:hypothetical protein
MARKLVTSAGKVADQADGIGEQGLKAGRRLQPPEFAVESSEHTGRFEHAGLGEGFEEGVLDCVAIADEGTTGPGLPRGAAAAEGGCEDDSTTPLSSLMHCM